MKKGFTLAEVLITLGVVGIVAVLTVPAVMKNYRNRMYVAQLKKVSAQLSDAAQAMMNDEHTDSFYETKITMTSDCKDEEGSTLEVCSQGMKYFLTTYLKTIKQDCLDGTYPCAKSGAGTYYQLDGTAAKSGFWGTCVQTVNGATVCGYYNTTTKCASFAVDVNGMGEPNTIGRDLFTMDVHSDGSLSDFASGCYDSNNFGCAASKCGTGYGSDGGIYNEACGCYSKVVKSGWKMDY